MFRAFIQENFIDVSSANRIDALILLPIWNWFSGPVWVVDHPGVHRYTIATDMLLQTRLPQSPQTSDESTLKRSLVNSSTF